MLRSASTRLTECGVHRFGSNLPTMSWLVELVPQKKPSTRIILLKLSRGDHFVVEATENRCGHSPPKQQWQTDSVPQQETSQQETGYFGGSVNETLAKCWFRRFRSQVPCAIGAHSTWHVRHCANCQELPYHLAQLIVKYSQMALCTFCPCQASSKVEHCTSCSALSTRCLERDRRRGLAQHFEPKI